MQRAWSSMSDAELVQVIEGAALSFNALNNLNNSLSNVDHIALENARYARLELEGRRLMK